MYPRAEPELELKKNFFFFNTMGKLNVLGEWAQKLS